MNKAIYLSILFIFMVLASCGNIKNYDAKVEVEPGTEILQAGIGNYTAKTVKKAVQTDEKNPMLGFWVGYFEQAKTSRESISIDEGFYWNRENKINISIDEIKDGLVKGHSVVAGNDRPFSGTITETKNSTGHTIYSFEVSEPGDHKYDGQFTFVIYAGRLKGTWTAYKDIEIKNRQYDLGKEFFEYDPNAQLRDQKRYIDWGKYIEEKKTYDEYDEHGEMLEWIEKEYASATDKIYEINASNMLLKKEDVENLKKGDLTIIRNTIYARHGYSFKNRPLRVFFDAQDWYIPVHTDIKADFTELEIKNIQLLLSYEKNAAEYYDSFGRG